MPCWIDPGEGVFRRGWLLEESSGSDGRRLQRDGSGGDCASLRVAHFGNLAPGTTPGPSEGPSPLPSLHRCTTSLSTRLSRVFST